MSSSSPLDRQVVFVTGKGGAGKTTVAAALAVAGDRSTVVCEVGGQTRLPSLVGDAAATVTIDPEHAVREWLTRQVPRPVVGALMRSTLFDYFFAAAPGLPEIVAMSKVLALTEEFDRVIVDLPSSGHGLAMLGIARTFHEVTRVGPVAREAKAIRDLVEDADRSALIAVALAEHMAISETLSLAAAADRSLRRPLSAVVVNGVEAARWTDAEVDAVAAAGAAVAARAVRSAAGRSRAHAAQLRRLRRSLDVPTLTLPAASPPDVGHFAARLAGC